MHTCILGAFCRGIQPLSLCPYIFSVVGFGKEKAGEVYLFWSERVRSAQDGRSRSRATLRGRGLSATRHDQHPDTSLNSYRERKTANIAGTD